MNCLNPSLRQEYDWMSILLFTDASNYKKKKLLAFFIMKKNLLEEVTIPVTPGSNLESCTFSPRFQGFARGGGKQILIEVATVTIMEDFGVGGV